MNDSEQDDYINYQLWIYEYCNVFEFHIGELSIAPLESDLFFNNARPHLWDMPTTTLIYSIYLTEA